MLPFAIPRHWCLALLSTLVPIPIAVLLYLALLSRHWYQILALTVIFLSILLDIGGWLTLLTLVAIAGIADIGTNCWYLALLLGPEEEDLCGKGNGSRHWYLALLCGIAVWANKQQCQVPNIHGIELGTRGYLALLLGPDEEDGAGHHQQIPQRVRHCRPKPLSSGPAFELATAEIRRHVVHIKAIEKDDLPPPPTVVRQAIISRSPSEYTTAAPNR